MNIDGLPYSIFSLLTNTGLDIFSKTKKFIELDYDNSDGKFKSYIFRTDDDVEIFSLTFEELDDNDILEGLHILFTKKNNKKNPLRQTSEISIKGDKEGNYTYAARDVDVSAKTPLEYKINNYNGTCIIQDALLNETETAHLISMVREKIHTYESKKEASDNNKYQTVRFIESENGKIIGEYIDIVAKRSNEYEFEYTPIPDYVVGGNYKMLNREFIKTYLDCKSVESYSDENYHVIKTTYNTRREGKHIIPEKYHYAVIYHTDNDKHIEICYTDFEDTQYIIADYDNSGKAIHHADYQYNSEEVQDIIFQEISDSVLNLINDVDNKMK